MNSSPKLCGLARVYCSSTEVGGGGGVPLGKAILFVGFLLPILKFKLNVLLLITPYGQRQV